MKFLVLFLSYFAATHTFLDCATKQEHKSKKRMVSSGEACFLVKLPKTGRSHVLKRLLWGLYEANISPNIMIFNHRSTKVSGDQNNFIVMLSPSTCALMMWILLNERLICHKKLLWHFFLYVYFENLISSLHFSSTLRNEMSLYNEILITISMTMETICEGLTKNENNGSYETYVVYKANFLRYVQVVWKFVARVSNLHSFLYLTPTIHSFLLRIFCLNSKEFSIAHHLHNA